MRLITMLGLVLLGAGSMPAPAVAQQTVYEELMSLPVEEFVDLYEVVLHTIFVRSGIEEGLTEGAMVLSPELMRDRGGRRNWFSVLPLAEAFQRIADRWKLPMEPRDGLSTIAGITHPIPHRVEGVYRVNYVLAPPGRLRPIRGFLVSMFLERGPDGNWRQRPPP